MRLYRVFLLKEELYVQNLYNNAHIVVYESDEVGIYLRRDDGSLWGEIPSVYMCLANNDETIDYNMSGGISFMRMRPKCV